jgi:hypothetical protein
MKDSEIIKQFREKFDNIRKTVVTIETLAGSNEQRYAGTEIESFILSIRHQYRQEVLETLQGMVLYIKDYDRSEVHEVVKLSDIEALLNNKN